VKDNGAQGKRADDCLFPCEIKAWRAVHKHDGPREAAQQPFLKGKLPKKTDYTK